MGEQMEGLGGAFQSAMRSLVPPRLGLLRIPVAVYGTETPRFRCPEGCRWEWSREGSLWVRQPCEHDPEPTAMEAPEPHRRTLQEVQDHRAQAIALLRRDSHLTAKQQTWTADNFVAYCKGWNPCLRLLRDCVAARGVSSSFGLYGPNGHGKSHLAAAAANALLDLGVPVYMSSARELFDGLHQESDRFGDGPRPMLWRRVRRAQVVILDDYGTFEPAPNEAVWLMRLLDHTTETDHSLILTSNLDPNDWGGRLEEDTGSKFPRPPRYREAGPAILSRLNGLMRGRVAQTPEGARCCRTTPVTEEERCRSAAIRLS